jgi:cytoskeletal protein RodZ
VAGKARKTASRGWGSTVTALAPLVATATDSAREAGTAAKKAKLKANARDAAKQARKQAKKNAKRSKGGSKFGKLLLAGAVVGAAGAAVARSRRARQDWEAYDPTSPVATAAERDTAPIPPASAEKPSAAVTTSTTTAAGTTREHAAKPETVGTNPVGGSTPPATANVRPAQTTPAAPATSANNNGGRS